MDPELVVPDPEKSLYDGAIEPWSNSTSTYYLQTLDGIAKHFRASLHTPWQELPEAMQELILYGSGDEKVELSFDDGLRRYSTKRPFEGVVPNLQRRWRETESAWLKEELGKYLSSAPCEACGGYRLKPEALAVKIHGRHIGEVTELSIEAAAAWFRDAAGASHRQAPGDRAAHPQGDQRAAGLPAQCRPRLPDARARFRHAVRRREPAHPARLADRLGPHRRALRPRRALDRPAPARQPAPAGDAEEPARPRQHGDRGRARRGGDPGGRPRGRHGAGRRRARRHGGRRGHAGGGHGGRPRA